MAVTPTTSLRLDPGQVDAARAAIGDPDASLSVLIRAGLAVLAGAKVSDALRSARTRPGPKRRTGAAV